jgi:hypothetical protein
MLRKTELEQKGTRWNFNTRKNSSQNRETHSTRTWCSRLTRDSKKPTLQHQQVPIERVRRKDCPCTERDLKRAFRNHISRWAAQTCPEFDFHYASVRTYLDASSLTSTYSVFEFAVHCERRAGYYIASYYVTLISCIAFTLMLFTAEPLVSERFENLIALTLTATALKFTLADHMPAEGSLTMLDQVMFFCVSLILSAGIETWVRGVRARSAIKSQSFLSLQHVFCC